MNIYKAGQIDPPLTVPSTTSSPLAIESMEEARITRSPESLVKSASRSLTARGLIGKVEERLDRVARRKKIDAKLILSMICYPRTQNNEDHRS